MILSTIRKSRKKKASADLSAYSIGIIVRVIFVTILSVTVFFLLSLSINLNTDKTNLENMLLAHRVLNTPGGIGVINPTTNTVDTGVIDLALLRGIPKTNNIQPSEPPPPLSPITAAVTAQQPSAPIPANYDPTLIDKILSEKLSFGANNKELAARIVFFPSESSSQKRSPITVYYNEKNYLRWIEASGFFGIGASEVSYFRAPVIGKNEVGTLTNGVLVFEFVRPKG